MMTEIQTLISHVNTLVKKNNEMLDATGSRFNMFGVLGVDNDETTHSAIVAELLNPKGSHALGDKFLQEFLKVMELQNFGWDTKQAIVTTEMWAGENGRMDIVIESCGKAVIIENKFNAGDQPEQLKRYHRFAEKRYKAGNYVIFYLTLDGKQASPDSGEGVDYKQISHKEQIVAWLKQCVMVAANYPIVRETINQYINYLQKITNSSIQTKMAKEITDYILATPERFNSAFELAACLNEAKIALQQRFWHALATACKQNNLNIDNEQEFLNQIDGWVAKYYTQSKNNKYYGISILVGNLPTGELVRYDINVQDNIYMGFVFDINGNTKIANKDEYTQKRDSLKEYDDRFITTSEYFIVWQHTSPRLNFAYFDTAETRQIADEKVMKEVVNGIMQKIKEDIEFAKSKFQIK